MVKLEQDNEILEVTEDADVIEHVNKLQDDRKALIEKQANKIVKKNRREISRLRKHAESCLIDDNKAGYVYSIGKLRKLTGNIVSDEILESLWATSREELVKIATSFTAARSGIE